MSEKDHISFLLKSLPNFSLCCLFTQFWLFSGVSELIHIFCFRSILVESFVVEACLQLLQILYEFDVPFLDVRWLPKTSFLWTSAFNHRAGQYCSFYQKKSEIFQKDYDILRLGKHLFIVFRSTSKRFWTFLLAQFVFGVTESGTRRERLKSAPYLRLKKRKSEFFSFRKCRLVPKNVKGGPFGLY